MHKFIPMLHAIRIPDAKAAVDTESEKLEKLPAWKMTKVKSKTSSFKRHRRSKEQSILLR